MKKLELTFNGSKELIDSLKKYHNTEIYFVGGCVRDLFLDLESKDIDLVIPHIPINDLLYLLGQYGVVDVVGKSFGVLIFKPHGETEIIDIAVPRKERSSGLNHTDFEVDTNTSITLIEDLQRRDFTFNAMAMAMDGTLIDPFGGLDAIKAKEVNIITEESFIDDPLRILRALQFSARFRFSLGRDTERSLRDNRESLINISEERIRLEFLKGISTDLSALRFKDLLVNTGVMETLFGEVDFDSDGYTHTIPFINSLSEFIFVCGYKINSIKSKITMTKDDFKNSKSIETFAFKQTGLSRISKLKLIFDIGSKNPYLYNVNIFNEECGYLLLPFRFGDLPKSFKDLDVTGDDLIKQGFSGVEVGVKLNEIVLERIRKYIENK